MKKQKKLIALVLAAALVFPASSDIACYRNEAKETPVFSDYAGNELYVEFLNGESKVYTYKNQEAMQSAAVSLSEREDVSVVQPNYTYTTAAVNITDVDYAQQWALYNDGSFSIEDEYDDFPIYDNPFDNPRNGDRFFGNPGGMTPGRGGSYIRHSVYSTSLMTEAKVLS